MSVEIVIQDFREPDGKKNGRKAAAVVDRGRKLIWTANGSTESVAATEAVRRFLADRRAREYAGGS